jgi:ABC-type branched-subunit amino acid transport system substrate-binding protein
VTKRRHLGFLLVVLCLVTSACGARLSKEQVAAANGAGAANGTGTGAAAGSGTKTTTAAPAAGSGTAGPAAGAPGAAAADPNAAAPGADPAAAAGGGGGACAPAPGSTDPGVSDTEIKLGNISTISGPVPGFGQTGQNGVKAYFNYINSQGGVCGRKLTLVTSDDRLDAGTNRSETERLSKEVFGFVGDTTVVDDGGADVLTGSIADCSLSIGAKRRASPNNFSPNPIDPNGNGNGTVGIFSWLKANMGLTKVAVVYPAQADARTSGQAYVADIQAAGLAVAGPYEVAVTETNYAGVASKIKTDAADGVITTLEVNGMAKLAQAFKQIGYTPKVPFYGAQAYGQQFLSLAGDAAEGTVLVLTYAIFEDAGSNPAVQSFVDWYQRSNPGSKPDFFSVMSWAAADMMVQAIQAAGPAPTRDKVLAALGTLTAFDAHGFMAPRNPAGKKIGDQFLVVKVQGGKWVRQFPDAGFSAG